MSAKVLKREAVQKTFLGQIERSTFVALLVMVMLSGCAGFGRSNVDSPQIYVDVTGSGKDQKTALDEALREAVRVASGVLISSKLQLTNDAITKDVLSEFSAGYVSSYDIKRTYQHDGQKFVEIGALISTSKLLGEYLFEKSANGKVAGEQLYARTTTYLKSKEQGDRFLEHLASSYPSNALSTTLGSVYSTVTENREIFLVVPYRMNWAKGYLEAFQETIGYVALTKCRTGTDKQPRRCDYNVGVFDGDPDTRSGIGYYLSDNTQSEIILKQMSDEVGFLVVVDGSAGDEIGRYCHMARMPSKFIDNDLSRISVANTIVEGRFLVQLANADVLNRIASVKVNLVRNCI